MSDGVMGTTQEMAIVASRMRSAICEEVELEWMVIVCGKEKLGVWAWIPSRTTTWCLSLPGGSGGAVEGNGWRDILADEENETP